ncbi:flavodoxin family protein [Solirubrum puertoriconensis]|uniref:BRAMP protein n=1 Tax=Solirubrum puertoriconensis TaxID=1751427 RepID=A0A9X0HKB4_SOLP1|nr:NAD(P)H-dependent oxidoreductase [Solirubrum puertoriconensis]KUG07490.1 BRAMP protein [Solirubrum puertoriconensis]
MKALFLNCTLKPSPQPSNTDALIRKAVRLFEQEQVACEVLRLADYNIKPGTSSDEGEGDEWPRVLAKIKACQILIIGAPVWVGHLSSWGQRYIERMDSVFHEEGLVDKATGQAFTYNKVGGVLITGNEDGAHASVEQLVWAMQEQGFSIPPNANSYWVGEAGPGPSYQEAGGERHLYTNKNVRYLVYNCLHLARVLAQHPYPTNLNQLNEDAKQESDPEKES